MSRLRLLTGSIPHIDKVKSTLGIVRPEGYRLVADPWGNRVRVELARIMDHLINHPTDRTRWRLLPCIIPTIKNANQRYEYGANFTYEANLTVQHKSGAYPRTMFVKGPIRGSGEQFFGTIVSPTRPQAIAKEKAKAGRPTASRPNPDGLANIGTWDPRQQSRAAQRLPGAAPALKFHSSTDFSRKSSNRAGRLLLIVGGLLILSHMGRQREAV